MKVPPATAYLLAAPRAEPARAKRLERFPAPAARRGELRALALPLATRYDLSHLTHEGFRPVPKGAEQDEKSVPSPLPVDDFLARLTLLLQPPLAHLCVPSGVLEWPAALLPYQRAGVAALLSRPNLLLADDMGLGKTIQAIAALRILFLQRQIETALLVCPASLLIQWRQEIALWAPELRVLVMAGNPAARGRLWAQPAHVKLISYETLRADADWSGDSPARRTEWGVVALDEASRIKNRESTITLACKSLPRRRSWALTGTPLENSLEDVASLLEFLMEEPEREAAGLGRQLKTVQLRRKKQDVLQDLPPKQITEVTLELTPGQRAAYDQAEREGVVRLSRAGSDATLAHVLELIIRLKQICNADPATGESPKLDDVARRMRTLTAEGHRALLFSQFIDPKFGIARAARELRQFQPLEYTGQLSRTQRAAVVSRFRDDERHKILLLSLRAGGVGLNLQDASYVFHLDRWWNPALESQADSRAHRMGQAYPVTVIRYLCAETVEERIAQTLQGKTRLFQSLVDDVSLDLQGALDEQDLFGLFGLDAPHGKEEVAGKSIVTSFSRMSSRDFEDWLAACLRDRGFQVRQSPPTHDGGIDLTAWRQGDLGLDIRLWIQCKNHQDAVGIATVRELRGVVPDRAAGGTAIVACPAGFTAEARAFAAAQGIQLWGLEELRDLEDGRESEGGFF